MTLTSLTTDFFFKLLAGRYFPKYFLGMLYFNRIPKTASFSVAYLLESIGFNHGYDVDFGERSNEVIFEDHAGITKDMTNLLQIQENYVYCRHFSFYNLSEWGYSWIPDWFTIVRDPIQRVNALVN